MRPYNRVYAAINLDAVRQNMEAMKANISEHTGIIGVIKTDGYGHGAVPVAKAIADYVKAYAVATLEEAVNLRKHHITKPVIILGPVSPLQYEDVVTYDVQPPIFQFEKAELLSQKAVSMGKTVSIQLALDTGMSRIGMEVSKEAADMVKQISKLPCIHIEGLFTHFSCADEADKTTAKSQIQNYQKFVNMLKERGVEIPVKHCSNSAGIIDLPEANFDMVRAGITIYGLYPSDEVNKRLVQIYPVMELKSVITYIKTIKAGTAVSYGGTFIADHDRKVATISIGYGDGYPRNLSGKGVVLIRGRRAPILGRVCMDQLMADVTEIPDVNEGDEVVLIGKSGTETITVEDLAAACGGFHYEIVCDIGKRVPRVYYKEGKIVGVKDYFTDDYSQIEF